MSLVPFIYSKEIQIDDAGWGDLILGTVIGALKIPEHKYMERRISVSAFQSPNFENKTYLHEATKIAKEILEAMQPDSETCFKICSGYVLSPIYQHIKERGFFVERSKITGELQGRVEKGFLDWCIEVGVPKEVIETGRRFYPILEWVSEKIEIREHLVKTGWKSWQNTWKKKAYEIHLHHIAKKTY